MSEERLDLEMLAKLAQKYRPASSFGDREHAELLTRGDVLLESRRYSDLNELATLLDALPGLIALCKDQAETIKEWQHNQWDAADYD